MGESATHQMVSLAKEVLPSKKANYQSFMPMDVHDTVCQV